MILLKHKPALLLHFEENGLYDINPHNFKFYQYTTKTKMIGNRCVENTYKTAYYAPIGYVGLLLVDIDLDKPFSVSAWLYNDEYGYENVCTDRNTFVLGYNSEYMKEGEYRGWFGFGSNNIKTYWFNFSGTKGNIHSEAFQKDIYHAWHHFEIDRDDYGYIHAFLDGIKVNKDRENYNYRKMGYHNEGTAWIALNNMRYMDELLATQHCLHTSNFTPPTSPYWWSNGNKIYDEKSDQYAMAKGSDEIAIL